MPPPVKPTNVIGKYEDGKWHFKLGDFGLAQFLGRKRKLKRAGTYTFTAPGEMGDDGPERDMFALGCVVYQCARLHSALTP